MYRVENGSVGRPRTVGVSCSARFFSGIAILLGLSGFASGIQAAELSVGEGGSLRVVDGERTFQLGGRARMSTAFYDEDVTDLPTGLELDLVLLNLRAELGNRWLFNAGFDFVGKSLFDVSVTRSGLPFGDLQVGQFRPQVGLFDGGAWIIFNQRSMIEQALAIPRTVGIGLEGRKGLLSYSVAVNGDQADNDTPGDDPLKYSGRLVVRPLPGTWDVFHVGVNAIYQETPETRVNRFAVDPIAAFEDTPKLLQAVQAPADHREVLGGEALWVHGPWSAQTEYMHARMDAPGEPSIDGYYVQGTYLLGAERRYSEQTATVSRPFLHDPSVGAWEFGLRYDTVDFSSAGGGSSDNVGVVVIRYFSNPLRLGTSLTHSAIRGGINGDEDIVSLQMRLQWFL